MKLLLIAICARGITGCTKTKPPAPELFKVDPATAAKLRGTVHFVGRKPPVKLISMDAEEACEKLHDKPVDGSGFVVGKDEGLADVFVYVKAGLEGKSFET